MRKRLTTALATGVLLAAMVPALGAAPAAAKDVQCDETGKCVVRCSQTTSNGNYITYDEGTEITVHTPADGQTRKYKCVNGNWVLQSALQVSQSKLGVLNPAALLQGVKGSFTMDVEIDGSVVDTITFAFNPGRPTRPPCDPQQVTC